MTATKSTKKSTTVDPQAVIRAELARTRPDKRGFRNVPIAGTNGALQVYQAPDGHLGVSWCPVGTNPKYAVRMSVEKAKAFKGAIDQYIGVAGIVDKMNNGAALPKPEKAGSGDGISLF